MAGFHQVAYGILIGVALTLTSSPLVTYLVCAQSKKQSRKAILPPHSLKSDQILDGVTGLIGTVLLYCVDALTSTNRKLREHATSEDQLLE